MPRGAATISSIADPSRRAVAAHQALRAIDEERDRVVDIRRSAVGELRDSGWTWQQIASLLGIHRNRAAHLLDRSRQ